MGSHQLTLRERQLEYLRILKELDRYCTENNLRYYMACGTLIGAVRHKGVIPWGDDWGVCMPRPDYLRLVREYKSDEFTLHTIYNDKAHPYNFGRLCCNRVFTPVGNKRYFTFGIDVYVINGAPSTPEEQVKHKEATMAYIKRKRKLVTFRSFLAKRNLWPYKGLEFPLLNRVLMKAEKEFAKYDYDASDYIWPYGGGRLNMRKEYYGTPIKLQFEDGLFNAPEHYHEVLSMGYGDYMKLPPEEKRKPYHTGLGFYWVEGSQKNE